jgi:transcriptional regulator with XRE-family HTH domain
MRLHTAQEPKLKTLGQRIRAVRVARHLTVIEVSQRVGISRVSYYAWEKDEVKDPGLTQILAFTDLVDVSLDWLLRRKGNDPDFIKEEKREPARRR